MKFTGKTVADAIDAGLLALGITEEEAKVEVISEGVKGLFGRVKKEAEVDVERKETPSEKPAKCKKEQKTDNSMKTEKTECPKKAKKCDNAVSTAKETTEFVQKILNYLELDATAELKSDGKETVILLTANGAENVIGRRGEVLDAIQTLAGAKENCGRKDYKKVVVDCENYREKREGTLINLARKLEAKATEIRREIILEPMNPFERRIIHTALAESTTVTTRSDGKEPNRYVVIVPNDKDEFSKPYNAGRNNSGKRTEGKGRRSSNGGKKFSSNGRSGGARSGGSSRSKSSALSFGTYLGNSLKDNNE